MTLSIDSLIRSVTADDVFEALLSNLETVGIPARSWRAGGVARSVLGALAEVGYQGATIVTSCVRGMFLALGAGAYLTAHAKDVYDVDRVEATYAAGEVTFSNSGGAVINVGANEMIVRSTETGARYRVPAAFIIPANGSVTVDVEAIEPGSASSAAPGEIDTLETPVARITVTNAAAIVGLDAETDAALVRRCITKKGTWSSLGPRDAYEHAVLSALLPDGTSAGITRVNVHRPNSFGEVTVVCATASGTPTAPSLDAATEAVEAKARPDTVTANVVGAVPKSTAHTITLWCRGGVAELLEELAEDALSSLIAEYPIGGIAKTNGGQGYLYLDAIAAAVIASSPEAFDVDFSAGAADIALAYNEVVTNTTTFDVRVI